MVFVVSKKLNEARAKGGRIVAVGTTSLRLLESAAHEDGTIAVRANAEMVLRTGRDYKLTKEPLLRTTMRGTFGLLVVSRYLLIDPDGKPVIGVQSHGITSHPYDRERPLRTASFPLTKLHPDRVRTITFLKEDRRLIGFLRARGDADTPYTVRMQPWGAVTGQLP